MAFCTRCGRDNDGDARFCAGCGTPLARVARREERKVVTVVFVDVVGSTARAARLDPEDVRAMLAPFQERTRQELERHGGTVEKYIGDAVFAVFGAHRPLTTTTPSGPFVRGSPSSSRSRT